MKPAKNESLIKNTIPGIIKAIQQAGEDKNKISDLENILISMYASSLLFLAAIANFIVLFFILSQDLEICLFNSLLFFLLGISFHFIVRMRLMTNTVTLIISVLSFLTLIFITVRFYDIIGPAVWTVAYIQLLLAMIRITSVMLYSMSLAILMSNIYILFHSFSAQSFHMNIMYYVIQIVLFIIVCIISVAIHKINTNRFYWIIKQFEEAKDKNKKITTLYEEITASDKENKRLAYHDHLTGLPNRLFLSEKLNHAISLSNRKVKMLAIMFLDLDDFKMINDTMGHDIGDQLLIEVSKRLVNTLRKSDTVARLGGDEFVIFIEDVEDIDYIGIVSEKILKRFNEPFSLNSKECFITTSIGVALCPTDGEDAEVLLKNADIAMYKAKEKGKNQYQLCNPEMKSKVIKIMEISNSLYRALERNELELYYQPQVNCTSNEIVGLEALIRWNHPELGMVMPDDFIPIAEQTGLIIPIGEWVLRTACKQNKMWQDVGFPRIRMGVNLSIKQFQNNKLVKDVEGILRETGLDPQYLELEITESAAMKEKDHILGTLNELKKLGIHIAIDDFGTEYSSLNYLKQLPADRIKIPMTFIQGIDVNIKDEAITKAIMVLAKNMGLGVIAEGVETKNQLDFLNQGMCDEIQGFYYFNPKAAREVEELLKKTKS